MDSGGFYSMATNADGSVNQSGINTFADSTVAFVKKYGFNGVDIDYEYPTTMKDAGNPLDHTLANARRAGLVKSYGALMKTLREKLDRASAADGKHYLLTVAAPSSGYLLRGMETFQVQKYLDYVNIMSYDLHGAWNEYVGPNASLFDDGKDAELAQAGVYSTSQYGGVGYLNTDWAYHYFRGSMPAGRINIGLPYYTRGFKNVQGGTNGLWGKAATTDCPAGAGLTKCGDGAVGIDNLWHDLDTDGKESPAGSNPMWHAKNLEKGVVGDYVTRVRLPRVHQADRHLRPQLRLDAGRALAVERPEEGVPVHRGRAVGGRQGRLRRRQGHRRHDDLGARGRLRVQRRQGPVRAWLHPDSSMYDDVQVGRPVRRERSTIDLPSEALDIDVSFDQFPLGDSNYPISPKLKITNNTTATLPGGTEFQFDYATSAPANAKDQSGFGTKIVRSDHTAANNVGGLKGDFNRVSLKLPSWQRLAPGASVQLDFVLLPPDVDPVQLDGDLRRDHVLPRR